MHTERSTSRRSIMLRLAANLAALFLLVSCNGDPLDTSGGTPGTGNNSQAPIITTSPSSTTVAAGQAAAFSVTASGAPPLSFQWRRGNDTIPGANSATYTLQSATIADNNAVFSVVVSNTFGSVTSSSATLTVR
jgi:hypothetical protein